MSTAVFVGLGVAAAGVGGFLLWSHNKNKAAGNTPVGGAATLPQPSTATPVNYVPPGGGSGSLQNTIAASVGGLGGLAVGSYFGGPVGGIVGAKVGTVVTPLATKVGLTSAKSEFSTQVSALRGTVSGVSQIAHGNVVDGTKAVVTNGLKSAAAPVTSVIKGIGSLF